MDGIFGGLFDLDRSGELDAMERGAEIGFIEEVLKGGKRDDSWEDEEDED